MLRVALFDRKTSATQRGGIELLSAWQREHQFLWLDICTETAPDERDLLQNFEINSLALADAQRDRHPPKLEIFSNFVFILLRDLKNENPDIHAYAPGQLALFISDTFIISRHAYPSPAVDKVWRNLCPDSSITYIQPQAIAYAISRGVADAFTPLIMNLELKLDKLEDRVVEHSDERALEELVSYGGVIKKIKRTLLYQRDVFKAAANNTHLQEQSHEYNDVYEQFERLSSLAALFQDIIGDLINGFISISAHRLNRIIKVLTIVTVIFLPLGLLAGLYGMNFEYIPGTDKHDGYFVLLGCMSGIGIGLLVLFRWLKWL